MVIVTKEKSNAAKRISQFIGMDVLPCMVNEYMVSNKIIAYIFFYEEKMYVVNTKNEVHVYVPR